jgi:hypothetical protein
VSLFSIFPSFIQEILGKQIEMPLEIVAFNKNSAIAAENAGADRILLAGGDAIDLLKWTTLLG